MPFVPSDRIRASAVRRQLGGRQTGRTHRMLEAALQALRKSSSPQRQPVVIVVHAHAFVRHCQDMLRKIGATSAELQRLRFITAAEEPHATQGWRGELFHDHAVHELEISRIHARARAAREAKPFPDWL